MPSRPLIALVDDDAGFRRGLSSLLRAEGLDVRAFESAEALLEALPSLDPASVLTDIQMPGMDGLALLSHLRAQSPALPVLMMTALPDRSLRERAAAAGAVCCLEKPVDIEALLRALRGAERAARD